MLWADTFALTARNTAGSRGRISSQLPVIAEVDGPALCRKIFPHILVVQREVFRDRDLYRTAFCTVGAARTGNRNLRVDHLCHLPGKGHLLFRQRLKFLGKKCHALLHTSMTILCLQINSYITGFICNHSSFFEKE